ncbi:FecR family protein [Altererythrobacter lutimaris]|uniref:FecR domain-containing protein n=1 Tax=Altererythrobacter lutimaris TaxID=2743979 RepID=A0A850HFL1_9SPHN|nr:FecR domain-containing protein [Altererythrobacter lutimaris]NVE96036.1 FecR domain-containing protein [Altererythrobacter lutimaris]
MQRHQTQSANEDTVTPQSEAADWFARMSNERVKEEDLHAFRQWRDASPANAFAYDRLAEIWDRAGDHSDAPSIMEMRLSALAEQPARQTGTRRAAVAAAIVLCVSFLSFLALSTAGFFPWDGGSSSETGEQFAANSVASDQAAPDRVESNPAPAQLAFSSSYSTRIGEMAEFDLPDGSSIALNTGSQVDVSYSAGRRMLALAKGEAVFTVAKDRARPFIVEAGNSRIVALGTVFAVRRAGDEADVTLIEGRVRVDKTNRSGADVKSAELSAGERLTVSPGREFAISKTSLANAASWRTGRLVFDNTPLSEVLDEFNRYSIEQHVLRDPELADFLVSGTFRIKSSEHFAATLEAGFPIVVRARDEGRTLEVISAQE